MWIEIELKHFFEASYCRWTKWLSSDVGGFSDSETLSSLYSKYGAYSCLKPLQIKARIASTKQVNQFYDLLFSNKCTKNMLFCNEEYFKPKEVTLTSGPQIYNMMSTDTGFQCLKLDQPGQVDCLDYEVQLCCSRKELKYWILFHGSLGMIKNSSFNFLNHHLLVPYKIYQFDILCP